MDLQRMNDLIEGLKRRASIQVGVFADKSARTDGGLTNAGLAAIHEYGSAEHNLPPRSMLRVPIGEHIKEIMEPIKGKAVLMLKSGSLLNLYKTIGIAAEKVVLGAFETGGYGKWPPLTYKTLLEKLRGPHGPRQVMRNGKLVWINKKGRSLSKRKGILAQIYAGQVGMGILVATAQLKRSFSSRVRLIN